jgi:hypothetical protein
MHEMTAEILGRNYFSVLNQTPYLHSPLFYPLMENIYTLTPPRTLTPPSYRLTPPGTSTHPLPMLYLTNAGVIAAEPQIQHHIYHHHINSQEGCHESGEKNYEKMELNTESTEITDKGGEENGEIEEIDVETVEDYGKGVDILRKNIQESIASSASSENGIDEPQNLTVLTPSYCNSLSYENVTNSSRSTPSSISTSSTAQSHHIKVEDDDVTMKNVSEEGTFESEKLKPKSIYPATDNDLERFTPSSGLRMIEEHHQYRENSGQDRRFKCQYCHKRFMRKEEKLRHERSHTNERKYQCKVCKMRFLRADHRKGHEETHLNVKKFSCTPCGKSFRRKDEFNRHLGRKICKANKMNLKK